MRYLKKTRLNKAGLLIDREGLRVGDAGELVGCENVSQLGREFKR